MIQNIIVVFVVALAAYVLFTKWFKEPNWKEPESHVDTDHTQVKKGSSLKTTVDKVSVTMNRHGKVVSTVTTFKTEADTRSLRSVIATGNEASRLARTVVPSPKKSEERPYYEDTTVVPPDFYLGTVTDDKPAQPEVFKSHEPVKTHYEVPHSTVSHSYDHHSSSHSHHDSSSSHSSYDHGSSHDHGGSSSCGGSND